MEFSPEQKKVIENFSDNILLLARAGAGKTFTVANRVAEAIRRGYKPEEILCLTFTVKAAGEIKDAVKAQTDAAVSVFTIHGFCYEIIKRYARLTGAIREPEVADEVDSGELLYTVLREYIDFGYYKTPDDYPMLGEKQLASIMSAIKRERIKQGYSFFSEDGYGRAISKLFDNPLFENSFTTKKYGVKVVDYSLMRLLQEQYGPEFCVRYQRMMQGSDLMDFDDLIFCAKEVVEQGFCPEYKIIIVDEMQDTSDLEYSVARSLFGGALVLLCGDPFQTIYTWRGSDPNGIMEDFKKNFNAKTVVLSGNRRSSALLSYAGNYYLAKTFDGFKEPEKPDFGNSEKIEVIGEDGAKEEVKKIMEIVDGFDGEKSDICVMARSNRYIADVYRIAEEINRGLPTEKRINFFTADGDYQFYKKPVVKDFLAFLRLLINPNDEISYERVAKKYLGITRNKMSQVRDYAITGITTGSLLSRDTYEKGDNFYSLIEAMKQGNVVVYDTETTGLDVAEDEIIQISAMKIGQSGEAMRFSAAVLKGDEPKFSSFVIPEREISEGAVATHGYSLEYIKANGAREKSEVLREFADFIRGAVLVGHNSAEFDDKILLRELSECGIKAEIKAFYDTLDIARAYSSDLPDKKLSTICERFGIENERAHDAMADVAATAKCLIAYYKQYIYPSEKDRRKLLGLLRNTFEPFYEDRKEMLAILYEKDPKKLVRYIDGKYGILAARGRPSDRASANDLYFALKGMEDAKDPRQWLTAFLSSASLSGSQMDIMIKKFGKVPLITVHQSKGCEFDTVILAGAGERDIPSYGARLSGEEDEEKRIFYVALTRAKRKFILTYRAKDGNYDRTYSPYVDNLPLCAVKFL